MRDLYEDHEDHEKTKHEKATYLSKKSLIHETHIIDSVWLALSSLSCQRP